MQEVKGEEEDEHKIEHLDTMRKSRLRGVLKSKRAAGRLHQWKWLVGAAKIGMVDGWWNSKRRWKSCWRRCTTAAILELVETTSTGAVSAVGESQFGNKVCDYYLRNANFGVGTLIN
ncbi:hypothetical protein TWF481_008329 [Arthrobotrys musiformis]|uniref:Uncharacterized protein n=1 Tax=Arthrobotrys musiformis TaxID=47236 RepID=A0AAV9W9A2_9PEZI